jgi:NAD(P)H-quinone oxidoreductase subunit 4L
MLINEFLLLGAVLFCIGVYGVIARRNGIMVLMAIELILNSVNINLLAFGVGLAMVLLIYRNRRSISLDELSEMKG